MSLPRASIIAGPARLHFRGQTVFSQSDIAVATRVRAFAVNANSRLRQRREDQVQVELTFTPEGAWLPMRALIQPLAGLDIGQDVFGGTDSPLVIDSTDGLTYTFAAGALTGPPEVVFSAGRTLFGPATFTAVGARTAAPAAAGRRLRISASTDPTNPTNDGGDPAAIVTRAYTLSWGTAAPWTGLETDAGIAVAFRLKFNPRKIDGAGVIGLRLADLTVTARARPLGLAADAVLAALRVQGAGAKGRGRALGAGAPDLVIRGGDGTVYACLYSAGLDAAASVFGATTHRVGELTWTAAAGRKPLFQFPIGAP